MLTGIVSYGYGSVLMRIFEPVKNEVKEIEEFNVSLTVYRSISV
jgi:hypothetical protein